jgi:hypothetical protein
MEKEYMYQNIVKKDDTNILINDYITDYGKGLAPTLDPTTDFGKGIVYYTCDGKQAASMDQVMQYNQMYYENMMIKKQDIIDEKSGGMHR